MLKRELDVESNGKLPHLFIPNKTATLVPKFAVEYLPLGRTAALVPGFAVKDLPLGRTFLQYFTVNIYFNKFFDAHLEIYIFYFRATLGVKEVLQSSKESTSKKCLCVCVSVCRRSQSLNQSRDLIKILYLRSSCKYLEPLFSFPLPLKLRVVYMRKKFDFLKKRLKHFDYILLFYSTCEAQQYDTIGFFRKNP